MPGSVTRLECVGARLLLKPGRKYQEAVDTFSPYAETKEPLPGVRRSGALLGVMDYLTKPVTRDALSQALNRIAKRVKAALIVEAIYNFSANVQDTFQATP